MNAQGAEKSACPVRAEVEGILEASKDLAMRVRRLRRVLRACRRCEARQNCGFLQAFNASVDAAIAEVTEEWNLGNR